MNIAGKHERVSVTHWRDGVVLVGFCGDVWPADLSPSELEAVKWFYNMPGSSHEIFNEWPEGIEPRYPAAKKNFKNGFLLLTKKED